MTAAQAEIPLFAAKFAPVFLAFAMKFFEYLCGKIGSPSQSKPKG
jgi:hypothetical protein